jgi:hypothetical protein
MIHDTTNKTSLTATFDKEALAPLSTIFTELTHRGSTRRSKRSFESSTDDFMNVGFVAEFILEAT